MRAVTKYVADDGLEFTHEAQCIEYEDLCIQVDGILSALPARPDLPGCGFENGDGYIQHDPQAALAARRALLQIANKLMPHKWFAQSLADDSVDPSWAGRMIDEMHERCLARAWYRFMCMTPDYREYGQPYFRNNPSAAKDVCLNAGSAA